MGGRNGFQIGTDGTIPEQAITAYNRHIPTGHTDHTRSRHNPLSSADRDH